MVELFESVLRVRLKLIRLHPFRPMVIQVHVKVVVGGQVARSGYQHLMRKERKEEENSYLCKQKSSPPYNRQVRHPNNRRPNLPAILRVSRRVIPLEIPRVSPQVYPVLNQVADQVGSHRCSHLISPHISLQGSHRCSHQGSLVSNRADSPILVQQINRLYNPVADRRSSQAVCLPLSHRDPPPSNQVALQHPYHLSCHLCSLQFSRMADPLANQRNSLHLYLRNNLSHILPVYLRVTQPLNQPHSHFLNLHLYLQFNRAADLLSNLLALPLADPLSNL